MPSETIEEAYIRLWDERAAYWSDDQQLAIQAAYERDHLDGLALAEDTPAGEMNIDQILGELIEADDDQLDAIFMPALAELVRFPSDPPPPPPPLLCSTCRVEIRPDRKHHYCQACAGARDRERREFWKQKHREVYPGYVTWRRGCGMSPIEHRARYGPTVEEFRRAYIAEHGRINITPPRHKRASDLRRARMIEQRQQAGQ